METQEIVRGSGILLAVSSLPSPYGIGTLGNAALRFIDLLVDLRQKYWQVLPVGPTSYGDSPYQALSAFAGNQYLIDLDELVSEGLLKLDEIRSFHWGSDDSIVDYIVLFENRNKVLHIAFDRFDRNNEAFKSFCEENVFWLEDFSLFMSIKHENGDKQWLEWPEDIKNAKDSAVEECKDRLQDEMVFWKFCQYQFFKQWAQVKAYANARGIQIIGDVSFYVGLDSADVWSRKNHFLLNKEGNPIYYAAAVPDKYSDDGQIWGNPVYNWEVMEEDGFEWWKHRIAVRKKLFDIIRIDHFTGMVKNYVVPTDAENTSKGKWLKAPGKHLVDAINEVLDGQPVIADDYTGKAPMPKVKKLLSKTGWMGTKVLLFAFDGDTTNEHLPHNYLDHQVAVYVGTHDNETIVGYFRDKTEYELAYLYQYLDIDKKDKLSSGLIRSAYSSIGDLAIVTMQDILELGNEARLNVPATVGNWRWRLSNEQLGEERRTWIRNLAAVYRR